MSTADRRGRLLSLAERVGREDLRSFLLEFLEDPRITFTDVEPKITLAESPAAPRAHHSYPGGLIDHTVSVVELSLKMHGVFSSVYGYNADPDYLIAGGLLHDIFKYYQYEKDPATGGFKLRSDWYLAHDYAIVAELAHRGIDPYLLRVISEVHGKVPFSTPEGLVLHLADNADYKIASRMQDLVYSACLSIERETNGQYLAVKLFYSLLSKYSLPELIPIIEKGTDALREFIKREIG